MAGFFGRKQVRVKVEKDYTVDEFYEIIKDHAFAAGKPEKIRYMMTDRMRNAAYSEYGERKVLMLRTLSTTALPHFSTEVRNLPASLSAIRSVQSGTYAPIRGWDW